MLSADSAGPSNFYVETTEHGENDSFIISDAMASYDNEVQGFFIKKKRPGDEITVAKLATSAQRLFVGPGGSREKEWKAILSSGTDKSLAVKVWRGKEAR